MNAMKVDRDIAKAIAASGPRSRLNPDHEDSHYYLGNCLAAQGDSDGALEQLQELIRINPQSHRGHSQWGTLRALSARSDADLIAAEKSLERAHQLNPEETGALLVLGEVALLRGDAAKAQDCFSKACRTNPKAVGALFLRGYLAWKRGDRSAGANLLQNARAALGKEWQPKGSTSEGEVKQRNHMENTPLSRFWENWNGETDPDRAFQALDQSLRLGFGQFDRVSVNIRD